MTLEDFNQRLQNVDPKLHVRVNGRGDIAGLFYGTEYIARMTRGELNINGYRIDLIDQGQINEGCIMKRGRKTLVKLLQGRLPLTLKQRASLLWGL
jgi:hypothetical protein